MFMGRKERPENIPKSAASDKEDLRGTVYDKGKILMDYIIMTTGRSPRALHDKGKIPDGST